MIPEHASICSVCRSYQRSWLNWLQYSSGVTALLVVAASAGLWLFGNARHYVWYHDDVKVIAANTKSGVVIWNRSDGDIFVSQLIFYMSGRDKDWIAPRVVFDERIAAGNFAHKDFVKDPQKRPGLGLVRGASASDFEQDIVHAVSNDPCYDLAFFESSDSDLAEMIEMAGPTLNTFPVAGTLRYWSTNKDEPTDLVLSGVGVVLSCLPNTTRNR
jgi:hypothetical protein